MPLLNGKNASDMLKGGNNAGMIAKKVEKKTLETLKTSTSPAERQQALNKYYTALHHNRAAEISMAPKSWADLERGGKK
jgi:hypothetical protein